jgi:hypothetical protein
MGRDVHADAIVRKANDTHVLPGDRAVEAAKSIVREYYDESMLSDVVYDENEGGLSTTPVGRGSGIKGKITIAACRATWGLFNVERIITGMTLTASWSETGFGES